MKRRCVTGSGHWGFKSYQSQCYPLSDYKALRYCSRTGLYAAVLPAITIMEQPSETVSKTSIKCFFLMRISLAMVSVVFWKKMAPKGTGTTRCGLGERSVSLWGMSFVFSHDHVTSQCDSLLPNSFWSRWSQHHICLHATMHSAMIMDWTSENMSHPN